jgi:hypothetical protein
MFYLDDALLQFSQISELEKADPHNVECLRQRLQDVGECSLAGSGCNTWGKLYGEKKKQARLRRLFLNLFTNHDSPLESQSEDNKDKSHFNEDLIVPRRCKTDALTLWVAKKFVPFYHALFKAQHQSNSNDPDPEAAEKKSSVGSSNRTGSCASKSWASFSSKTLREPTSHHEKNQNTVTYYSKVWMIFIASTITTVVASLLPIVAITILTKIHTMGETLGIIALFTALFAIGLSVLARESTRVEIFTATAA